MLFFDTLFLFLSGDDAGSKNKRALKQIAKDLNQNKYRKFYTVKTGELTPAAGMFFYEVYKTVAAAQVFIKHAEKSGVLKQITMESVLDKELREIYDRIVPDSIEKRAKIISPHTLSQQAQDDLNSFSLGINAKIHAIDQRYSLILAFISFVNFDFFSLLKKFDSRIRENQFSYTPQCRPMIGKYVVEHIKDFLELPSLDASPEEWQSVFEILKKYKSGKPVIDPIQWKRVLQALQDLRRSGILPLIVQYIEQNPEWRYTPQMIGEHIAEAYIKEKTAEVQGCLNHITGDKRIAKREALAKKLFGAADIVRLQHYTPSNNETFINKNIEGFVYAPTLNYLKGFLTDHGDLQELCDLFVIRGQWASPEASRQISQGQQNLTDIVEQLADFDAMVSDRGLYGSKLKLYLTKSNSDKSQTAGLKVTLGIVNGKAEELISQGVSVLTKTASYLKKMLDDYRLDKPKLLVNWKEIEGVSVRPLALRLEEGCAVVEQFLHLLQLFDAEEAA
jgi:hypothetical protein